MKIESKQKNTKAIEVSVGECFMHGCGIYMRVSSIYGITTKEFPVTCVDLRTGEIKSIISNADIKLLEDARVVY